MDEASCASLASPSPPSSPALLPTPALYHVISIALTRSHILTIMIFLSLSHDLTFSRLNAHPYLIVLALSRILLLLL